MRARRVAVAIGVAVVVTGCAAVRSSDGSSSSSGALEGPTWRLVQLGDADPAALAAVRGGVTVRFASGRLSAFAGCNRVSGAYAVDGDQVTPGPLVGTMMACPAPVMAIEHAVKYALSGPLRFAVDGQRLTLTPAAEAAPTLVLVPAGEARLEGVAWQVTGYADGSSAVASPVAGTSLTLTFTDGTVTGHAGCNTFRAPYTLDGDGLTVAPAATTRKACPGEGVMAQERAFLAALASATRWQIERDQLELSGADGRRVLTARTLTAAP